MGAAGMCACVNGRGSQAGGGGGAGRGIDSRAAPAPRHSPVAERPWKDTLSS